MRLSYLTFIARDVAALAQFYIDGLGLEEVEASRDHRYREVRAGGCMIGFAHEPAREMLHLAHEANPVGIRSLATFDVGSVAAVTPAVERAVAHGAMLVRPAFDSPFGQHQAVLRDPEGNVFRISAAVGS
jgi:catechol 2,3-dioxygenase-like lactoylglutathione lyase family enzyme